MKRFEELKERLDAYNCLKFFSIREIGESFVDEKSMGSLFIEATQNVQRPKP